MRRTFIFLFLQRFLAVPLTGQNFGSAPLFFFRAKAATLGITGAEEERDMTTESIFTERWKVLESATRSAFPTWDGKEVEKFLKKMHVEGVDFTRLMALRMVRNAFAHNPMLDGRPIVSLNAGVIPFLDDVIAHIKKLPMAANILIPRSAVFSGLLNDTIASVVETMLKNVYSHVPVLDAEGKVVGVFSESTMLEMNKAGIKDDGKTTLNAVAEFLPCDRHVAEVFKFVPKNDSIAHIRHLCAEALQRHERIGMFFVTENGKSDELLLGILTVWDVAGVLTANGGISDGKSKGRSQML